ncbi:MAG: hypothetical protein JWQ96_3436 [Segetibacter sp.]|nr:hypothetical protein [Segetibacter sp.]
MDSQEEILSIIKALVKEAIPDAKVYLFGSRATGKIHEESDWDVLVLTSLEVNRNIKHQVHDKLFPLSVEISSFINSIVVNSEVWLGNPSFYALRQSIKDEAIAL